MYSQGHQILLVEDDVDDRFLMHHCFNEMNYSDHVKMFSSVEDMIRYIDILPDESLYPALIVLDYNMPGMNGSEALRHLKKNPAMQHIPVVIYSTSMKPILAESLKLNGALHCFEKGISPENYLSLAKTFKSIAEGDTVLL